MRWALLLVIALLGCPGRAAESDQSGLPHLGAAPDFALVSQAGTEMALDSLRGKVVAVTFIYTWCPDVCPMLTYKMVAVKDLLGDDFGARVAFVTITFDPERDTPEVLKAYAETFHANIPGWSFLTGDPVAVREVIRAYGVIARPAAGGTIDHTTLTTLIDRHGVIRVQYIGYRFDPDEMRRDLVSLVNEP